MRNICPFCGAMYEESGYDKDIMTLGAFGLVTWATITLAIECVCGATWAREVKNE